MLNIKNTIIATACAATAIAAGNIVSSLILNKIYSPSKEDVDKINDKIHEVEMDVHEDIKKAKEIEDIIDNK